MLHPGDRATYTKDNGLYTKGETLEVIEKSFLIDKYVVRNSQGTTGIVDRDYLVAIWEVD